MSDLTRIAASIAAPSLGSALQQAPDLPLGQAVEAKIAQILSDGLIRLTSSFGTFDLKASHPALQPGVAVRLDISESGNVTLTVLPPKAGPFSESSAPVPQAQAAPKADPAVIATLTGKPAAPQPTIYSATGQTVQSAPVQQSTATSQPAPPLQQNQSAVTQLPLAESLAPAGPASIAGSGVASAAPAPVLPASTQVQSAAPQAEPVPQTQAPGANTSAPAMTPAVSAALGEALAKQGGIAPLLANLDQLTKLTKPLPQSLAAAIDEVLQVVQPLSEEITPQTVRQAIKSSGVFNENNLVQFVARETASGAPQPDFKAALLKLVAVLAPLNKEAPVQKNEEQIIQRVPPPRGAEAPEPQASREATLSAQSTQQDIAGILAKQAEQALARVRVLQFGSMPVADAPDAQVRPTQTWHVDLPLLINGQGSVIPLTIERDAEKRDAQEQHRSWRIRFALDLASLGAVHALLALNSGLLDVTLWAERRETYDLFRNMTKDLHYALLDEELDVNEVEFRAGSPRSTTKRAGSYLDTRT